MTVGRDPGRFQVRGLGRWCIHGGATPVVAGLTDDGPVRDRAIAGGLKIATEVEAPPEER
jgi:hypothetical protein